VNVCLSFATCGTNYDSIYSRLRAIYACGASLGYVAVIVARPNPFGCMHACVCVLCLYMSVCSFYVCMFVCVCMCVFTCV
jgi:hypothetical protein